MDVVKPVGHLLLVFIFICFFLVLSFDETFMGGCTTVIRFVLSLKAKQVVTRMALCLILL